MARRKKNKKEPEYVLEARKLAKKFGVMVRRDNDGYYTIRIKSKRLALKFPHYQTGERTTKRKVPAAVKHMVGRIKTHATYMTRHKEIRNKQDSRTNRAKTADAKRTSKHTIEPIMASYSDIQKWLRHPERYDIEGADTKGHRYYGPVRLGGRIV